MATVTGDTSSDAQPWLIRVNRWARRYGVYSKLALTLGVLLLFFGVITYLVWTDIAALGQDSQTVLILILVDLALLLTLLSIIFRHLVRLWIERRAGAAGSRLHTRFVALFSAVAVVPVIVTAFFSAAFFQLGIQDWFSERVRTALQESLAVSEAYVVEHRQAIRADLLAMANDINRQAPSLLRSPSRFSATLNAQIILRNLSEAIVFSSDGAVLARTPLSLMAAFGSVPVDAFDNAANGDVVIFSDEDDDQVKALVRLDALTDGYLFVGRFVDPEVLHRVELTRKAVSEYNLLEGTRSNIQINSALVFVVLALMLLLGSVWLGLILATRLVRPISALVQAAERVRQGDLAARVSESPVDDELATLSRAFNRMTRQLESQRGELVDANRQLDRRRRFTEAVFSGVSAGIIGLDRRGIVSLPNRSAALLLDCEIDDMIGRPLQEVAPELADLLAQAQRRPERRYEEEIVLNRGGQVRNLHVRIGTDLGRGDRQGYVITFDDITELVGAQRMAAWADVARRIAHEIKNPLTPIQLSAERLRRRFKRQITEGEPIFSQCIDTITRQVGDIGRMVDEFSSFARMPAPNLQRVDLSKIAQQSRFAAALADENIDYEVTCSGDAAFINADPRQMEQLFRNLLKNAAEAIQGMRTEPGQDSKNGIIRMTIENRHPDIHVIVSDNGPGFPIDGRDRLTEPYVTHRAKGTGLGLAIVKKIVEDHGGKLKLEDAEDSGAQVRMIFTAATEEESVRGVEKWTS